MTRSMRGYRVVNALEKAGACQRPAINDWWHSLTLSASAADMRGGIKHQRQCRSARETCIEVQIPATTRNAIRRKTPPESALNKGLKTEKDASAVKENWKAELHRPSQH